MCASTQMEHLLGVLADAARAFGDMEGAPAAEAAIAALAAPAAPAAPAALAAEDPLLLAVLEHAQVADLRWSADEDESWNRAPTEPPSPDDEPEDETAAASSGHAWEEPAAASSGHAWEEPAAASSGHAWEEPASASDHPWEVASTTRGRSSGLTEAEQYNLKEEERCARLCGVPWSERGPTAGEAPYWRGQGWRSGRDGGKVRYATRGGKHREYYAELAKAGRLVVKHTDPWKGISIVPGTGEPKGKGKGKKGT